VGGHAWQDLFARFCPPERNLAVQPDPKVQPVYREFATSFENRLNELLA
jgi:hypothetical protein